MGLFEIIWTLLGSIPETARGSGEVGVMMSDSGSVSTLVNLVSDICGILFLSNLFVIFEFPLKI